MYCFKYIIIHKSLYTIAVLIDLRGRIKGILSAFLVIIHRVLYLHRLFKDVFQTVEGTKSCDAHMYTLTPHSHNTHTNLVCLARPSLMFDVCATALNQMGMVLSNCVAGG